jgi:hypothetical protein
MEIVIVHINYNLWFRFPNIIVFTNSCFTLCYLRFEQLYATVLRQYEMRNHMSETPSNIQLNVSWLSIWTKRKWGSRIEIKRAFFEVIFVKCGNFLPVLLESCTLIMHFIVVYLLLYACLYVYIHIYRVFILQAYQTSQYVVSRGGIFLVQYTRCSLCRLIRLLSTSNIHGVHCAGLSDFSVRGVARRYFSRPIYTVFTVQAYQTSQYVVSRGGIFLVQYTRCSLCRLIRLLSTWCRAAAFFLASDAALSHEIPTVKLISNQPALWTPGICCKLKFPYFITHNYCFLFFFNINYILMLNLIMKQTLSTYCLKKKNPSLNVISSDIGLHCL